MRIGVYLHILVVCVEVAMVLARGGSRGECGRKGVELQAEGEVFTGACA